MISPATQMSLSNAKSYFREHLKVGDYYSEEAKIHGEWYGQGAAQLGLNGVVTEEAFLRLCNGDHPATGEQLTQRRNTFRLVDGQAEPNRRVLYDFVMRPPKSVSIVALIEDSRIIELHDKAARLALAELEKHAQTRVRRDGANEDRTTGNILAALFRHDTSREQDPLLHTHCTIFNATFDKEENRWKALQNCDILRTQKLASAIYDNELVKGLRKLGYGIQQEGDRWEIQGISREMIQTLSKRRAAILAAAKEQAKTAGLDIDEYTLRDRIARDQRKRKIRNASAETLRARWKEELGKEGVTRVRCAKGAPLPALNVSLVEAAKWARDLVFERNVAVSINDMEAAILRRSLGADFARQDVRAVATGPGVQRIQDTEKLVSVDAWQRETEILQIAREGRNTHAPIIPQADYTNSSLDQEQQAAAKIIANSRDTVTLFRGQAGTGKSHTLRSICNSIKETKKPLFVVAPQGQQARDLTNDGMDAETLSRFLVRPTLPKGVIVLLDEAGQVGGKAMKDLLHRVDSVGGRIILSGDTRQHGAVEASDALRVLEQYGKLPAAELKTIRRQDPNLAKTDAERISIVKYRDAVSLASKGEAIQALAAMVANDSVKEVKASDFTSVASIEYLRHREASESALVVSQTRDQVKKLNSHISAELEQRGLVKKATDITSFSSRDLLSAEKVLPESYAVGHFVKFNRRYGVIEKGSVCEVTHVHPETLVMRDRSSGKLHRISFKESERWDVLEMMKLRIGEGSKLQLRSNGLSLNRKEYSNGELVTVKDIWPDQIVVQNAHGTILKLDPSSIVANHGYAVTSYGSQGKTVSHVIMVDSGNVAAQNQKEFYVSLSRGRRSGTIITQDVRDLANRVRQDGARELAIAVAGGLRPQAPQNARRHVDLAQASQRVQAWAKSVSRRSMAVSQRTMKFGQEIRRKLQHGLHL